MRGKSRLAINTVLNFVHKQFDMPQCRRGWPPPHQTRHCAREAVRRATKYYRLEWRTCPTMIGTGSTCLREPYFLQILVIQNIILIKLKIIFMTNKIYKTLKTCGKFYKAAPKPGSDCGPEQKKNNDVHAHTHTHDFWALPGRAFWAYPTSAGIVLKQFAWFPHWVALV